MSYNVVTEIVGGGPGDLITPQQAAILAAASAMQAAGALNHEPAAVATSGGLP